MNYKLFHLIYNEKTYKRYYYQPIDSDQPNKTFFYRRLKGSLISWIKAAYLPFFNKYNTQQIPGPRKSVLTMVWENLLWRFKYNEVCLYYFVYGLDVKGRSPKDYMAYTEFRIMRNILNIRQRENTRTKYTFNYLSLVRDKFIFYQYCKSLNMPCPKTLALVSKGRISWYNGENIEWKPLETIQESNFLAFCKETTGEGGQGAFILEVNNGEMKISGKLASVSELYTQFGVSTYILQEMIKNHHLLSEIYPKSLNTLRLHTILNRDGSVDFFSAVQRFGANGSIVDNGCFGGMFVGVSEDGVLNNYGCHEPHTGNKKLIIKEYHPNTNVKFAGLKLPFWEDILKTAKSFHRFMYGIPSIGWDIAITEDGFYFTEAGEDWEIAFDQAANGPQRKHFYETHGYSLGIKLRNL